MKSGIVINLDDLNTLIGEFIAEQSPSEQRLYRWRFGEFLEWAKVREEIREEEELRAED